MTTRYRIIAAAAGLVLGLATITSASAYRGDSPPGYTPPVVVPPSDCRDRCNIPPAVAPNPPSNEGPSRGGRN